MLSFAARHGRHLLILGLLVGVGLPGLAAAMLPWAPAILAVLLFLNAFRTGPRLVQRAGAGLARAAGLALALQLALPLAALAALHAAGLSARPFAFAAVLMLAAPAITGAPNFVVMTGNDPAPAMRMLVTGTLLFPLTALAVLWAMPGIAGDRALGVSLRLAAILCGVVGTGLLARVLLGRRFAATDLERATDGASAILLSVVVIGLMSAVGPEIRTDPLRLAGWIAAVTALNFALQLAALSLLAGLRLPEAIGASVCAGNRNIALFLLALPDEVMRPALLFIGCYQIPMFLTPLVMHHLHRLARERTIYNDK